MEFSNTAFSFSLVGNSNVVWTFVNAVARNGLM